MKQDYKKRFSDFEAEAASQDIGAMLRLADMLEGGWRGAEADPERAQSLVRQVAELGHGASARRVGDGYFRGRGVAKDVDEAMRWYRRGAEAGDVSAMANLLGDLNSGDATKRAESLRWLEKAALAGQPHALHLASGRPPGSLDMFAAQSLEEIAELVARDANEFEPTFTVTASSSEMNVLLGEFVHACQRAWPDMSWVAESNGDDVDMPSPEPHGALDEAEVEMTFYLGLRHVQLTFYREDDDWELVFGSFEPHPTLDERAALVQALRDAAGLAGLTLQGGDEQECDED